MIHEQNIKSNMQDQEGEEKELLTQRYGSSVQSLRASLEQKWAERNIDSCYQKTILAYLKTMSPEQSKLHIIKEHEKLLSNRSPVLRIQHMMTDREQIMASLLQMLTDQNNLESACQSIDELRKINLKISEAIFSIKQELQTNYSNPSFALIGYGSFFQKLNSDNAPIIQSYLRNYICFTHSYDPFFLNPYERIEAEGLPEDTPDPIVKLFKMNISYVYRLIKAKNDIVKFLSTPYDGKQARSFSKVQRQPKANQKERYQAKQVVDEENQAKYNTMHYDVEKKSPSFNHKRFQTIHGDDNQFHEQRKFTRRILHKSQPKNLRFSDPSKNETETNEEKPKPKFKIRQLAQQERQSSNLRHRTENYEITEDEDINVFRKKMLARREKRKRISLIQRKQEDSEEELRFKKRSLDLDKPVYKHQNYSEQFFTQMKPNVVQDQQGMESSSQEQPMEPRGIEQISTPYRRYRKGRPAQFKIKESIRTRRERIKLEPIIETKTEIPQIYSAEEKVKRSLKVSEKYHPISPQIKEMNKQSSSSNNSGKKLSESDQAYTGKRQEELFQKVCRDSEEKSPSTHNIFRIKKKPLPEISDQTNEKSTWAENHTFTPIQQTNQQKFKDGHIRKINLFQNQASKFRVPTETANTANTTITKKFQSDWEPQRPSSKRKVQKQSPSRIGTRTNQLSFFKPKNDDLSNRGNILSFSDRLKEPIQNGVKEGNHPSKETEQKILKQIEEELDDENNKKKQIKMKPGEIKLADLYSFIEKQKINQFQRQQFEVGLWKENINLKHSYLTKFYMNSELAAFGISSPRCDGDYSILYWGTTCPENFTSFLFGKYLDYLEKFTNLNNIYIGSPGYSDADFHKKGSSFVRGRKKHQKRELPYVPFLSLECSNICFEQKSNRELSLFFSQQIQQFSSQNSKPSSIIGFCDPQDSKTSLPEKSQFHCNINSISEVNKILEKVGVDTYATSEKIQIKQCKLFILKDNCSIKSNYFYVRNGYFVPKGVQIYSKERQKIIKLQMNKQDYFLYFGKKFPNVEAFLGFCSPKANGPCEFFAFKMFSKQLYGRIKNNEFCGMGCYGNWDVNFLWQDQLKGTVIKDMPSSQYTFGPQNFHVAIFKGQTLLLGFQVKSSDFFF